MLKTFWKPKKRYQFILKSGASFVIKCNSLDITWHTSDLSIASYKFDGIEGAFPFHIVVSEIAAIVRL